MIDKKDIERLVDQELMSANGKYPLFRSPHEAFAVLMEEIEEMETELKVIDFNMTGAWSCVKQDEDMTVHITNIYNRTMYAIMEAIQVAAMCKKFTMSNLYSDKK
jgi:hypothetical protein